MRNSSKTLALVLRKKALPQKDIFVVLLSKEFGKLHCIAKGTRSLTSRRAPHLQTGNLVHVQLNHGPVGYMIHETSLQTAFKNVKQDLARTQLMYVFFFVLDKMIPEELPDEQTYQLTIHFLKDASELDSFTMSTVYMYLRKLLEYQGYSYGGPSSEMYSYIEDIIGTNIPRHDIM